MIANDFTTALDFVRDSEYQFTLTGSRRFGGFTANSDYDFFVQFAPGLIHELEANGFRNISKDADGYPYEIIDKNLISVYRRENVDIQVRKNAELHERICKFIETAPSVLGLIEKSERYIFWNALIKDFSK